MNELVVEKWKDSPISFRKDGWVNLTEMCAAFGKKPYAFLRIPSTKVFLTALAADLGLDNSEEQDDEEFPGLVQTNQGGDQSKASILRFAPGTWSHPDVAMECARWLSPDFGIWCNRVVRCVMAGEQFFYGVPEWLEHAYYEAKGFAERLAIIDKTKPFAPPGPKVVRLGTTTAASDVEHFWFDVHEAVCLGLIPGSSFRCKHLPGGKAYALYLHPEMILTGLEKHCPGRYNLEKKAYVQMLFEDSTEWQQGGKLCRVQRFTGEPTRCWPFIVHTNTPIEPLRRICKEACEPTIDFSAE